MPNVVSLTKMEKYFVYFVYLWTFWGLDFWENQNIEVSHEYQSIEIVCIAPKSKVFTKALRHRRNKVNLLHCTTLATIE